MAQARTYTLVDTGQTSFYNNTTTIGAPSPGQLFYGQDATYSGNQPSYASNSNGTVTDQNTGLIWSQPISDEMTWSEAVAYADSATYGGYDDWRLPTIKELYSLINFTGYTGTTESNSKPYIDTTYFSFTYGSEANGERMIDSQYWSSTYYTGTVMGGAGTAFGVNFADGRIKGYPAEAKEATVLLVRGNTEYGINKFYDNGDGTVTDEATGLMWSSADSGYAMNWQSALTYAENSTLAGYADWRLPNIKELQSIVDYTQSPDAIDPANVGPAIDDNYFQLTNIGSASDPDYGYYWSGTTHVENGTGDYASYVSLGTAWGYTNGAWQDVHGAGAQRSDPKFDDGSYPDSWGPQGDYLSIDNYVLISRNVADDSTVTGGGGTEALYGQTGNDLITGGAGYDTILSDSGRDFILGGDDGDMIQAGPGADTVYGNAGADWIDGEEGADAIYAGADDDTVIGGNYGDTLAGERGNDLVYGNDGIDWIYGNAGNDFLFGGNDTDVLYGGADNDWLAGEAGSDWLSGDRGNDSIIGGAGADYFMYLGSDGGWDTITDFSASSGDRLLIYGGTSWWNWNDAAGNAVVGLSNGSTVTLSGVSQVTGDFFAYL